MTLAKRLTAAGLLLAVVLAGVLLFRPAETTYAAWSDEVTVAAPTMQTGGIRLEITPRNSTSATVTMAGDTAGTWRPVAVRVSADGRELTGAELAGSRIEYRQVAAEAGPAPYNVTLEGSGSSFPVAGERWLEGAGSLYLTFIPSDRALVAVGDRTLTFTTAIDGVSQAPVTWTAAASWSTDQRMPGAPRVSGLQCIDGTGNQRVTLTWDWDRQGLGQDVSRWAVQLEEQGAWKEISSLGRGQRHTGFGPQDFHSIDAGVAHLRIAAVLPDGTTIPSAGTATINLVGSLSCV